MAVVLPKTLVISITVHGVIPTEGGKIPMFTVPAGMNITKVNAVPPGVCNVMADEDAGVIQTALTKIAPRGTVPEYTKLKDLIPSILPKFIELRKGNVGIVRSDPVAKGDLQYQDFVRYSDQGFQFVSEGPEMINKQYSRSPKEGLGEVYNYKINAVNVLGSPDLFDYYARGAVGLPTRGSENAVADIGIQLDDLVSFLKDEGVKNLIIFDFACSTLSDDTLSPRDIRILRRGAKKIAGGKKTRRRSKTKTLTRKRRQYHGFYKTRSRSVYRRK